MISVKKTKRIFAIVALMCCTFVIFSSSIAMAAQKKKYTSWQEVAIDMSIVLDEAAKDIEADEYKQAYDHINDAYFGYYEVQGFEKNVMNAISRDRVRHMEGRFREIKHILLGNQEGEKHHLLEMIENLKVKLYRDAMVLDGVVGKKSEDIVGIAIYGDKEIPKNMTLVSSEENSTNIEQKDITTIEETTNNNDSNITLGDDKVRNHFTFIAAFGLLLREGLEAILVIVAIITYLIKTGNKKMCKSVYIGSVAAIFASILLAGIIEILLGGTGVAQELIEGYTMFMAVIVLFYVSNWMVSKSDAEAWKEYIDGKVQQSIDKKSEITLVFAAFLAVMREGAELILFYKAQFSGGMNDPKYIVYGIVAGTIVLAIIYVIFRYTTVRLPLKPFFIFTSILLFLMCISFMGKGVIELTEANVITGSTSIPALEGLNIDILNITNRAEMLIPQMMILIASVWLLVVNCCSKKKSK